MNSTNSMNKKFRPLDVLLRGLIWISATLVAFILIGIVGYTLFKGIPGITWELLTSSPSELLGTFGILPMIINTLYIVMITLLIATPIGICSAIYLNEYAGKNRFVKIIEFTTETLAGIPSIIYGLFGSVFFCVVLRLQRSILAGALTLTLMVLPTLIRTTQESLKAVPDSFREGALGIGSTKLHLIRTILLPSAMPGILTAVILSMGRIVGESAALLFTSGMGYGMPKSVLGHAGTSGATLTVQLYQYAMRGEDLQITFAMAAVLILLVLGINLTARFISKRFQTSHTH